MQPLPNNGTFARMHTREEPHSSKKLLKAVRNLNQGGNSCHAAEEDTGGVSNRPGNVLLGAPQAVHNPQSAVNSRQPEAESSHPYRRHSAQKYLRRCHSALPYTRKTAQIGRTIRPAKLEE